MVPDSNGMVGYQTQMVGYQRGGGIPDAGGGIPDANSGIPMQVGFQTWDNRVPAGDGGVPGRGRVTTLTSHQSKILHYLFF